MTSALWADLQNEFEEILAEAALLQAVLESVGATLDAADEAMSWVVIGGLAAGCKKIYSGCERVMDMLARRVDGAAIEKTERWHAVLLNRMANPFAGVRGAIISVECRAALDRFRAFRHRVRSTYGLRMDQDIVLSRASEVASMLRAFHHEVATFVLRREGGSPVGDAPRRA